MVKMHIEIKSSMDHNPAPTILNFKVVHLLSFPGFYSSNSVLNFAQSQQWQAVSEEI
jgi:hypothetical protein